MASWNEGQESERGRAALPARAPRARRIRAAICVTVALALAASAPPMRAQTGNLPRLGDPGGGELSQMLERRIGEAIMRDLRRNASVLDDTEGTDYLNRLAVRLPGAASAEGLRFEFFLVSDPSLNAFALPGGFIGVHTGLMLAAQSESELASVLAHEMAHVTQRHIARMLERERQGSVLSIAALVLAALAVRSNPQAAGGVLALGESVQNQQMLSFSRDAEREADRIGLEMLTQAGFDPRDMVGFFGRIQRASRFHDTGAPAYLQTHPFTTDRMADIQGRVRDAIAQGAPARRDDIGFELVRARLRALADRSVDGLRLARAHLEAARGEGTGTADGVRWYGLAVIAHAQRDFEAARQALAQARSRVSGGDAYLDRVGVEVELDAGMLPAALALADAALRTSPRSRTLVQLRARALLGMREFPAAVGFITERLREWPADSQLWKMLAEAQFASGNVALAHQATAEQYALAGAWPAAIEQLQLARRTRGLDFYTGSRIDARLRELEQELRREREDSKTQRRDG